MSVTLSGREARLPVVISRVVSSDDPLISPKSLSAICGGRWRCRAWNLDVGVDCRMKVSAGHHGPQSLLSTSPFYPRRQIACDPWTPTHSWKCRGTIDAVSRKRVIYQVQKTVKQLCVGWARFRKPPRFLSWPAACKVTSVVRLFVESTRLANDENTPTPTLLFKPPTVRELQGATTPRHSNFFSQLHFCAWTYRRSDLLAQIFHLMRKDD